MKHTNILIIASIALLMLSYSCSDKEPDTSHYTMEGEVSWLWPLGLPDDIVPLPGEIITVWSDPTTVDVLYSGLKRETVIAYKNAMQKNGFECEYFIYTGGNVKKTGKSVTYKNFSGVFMRKGQLDLRLDVKDYYKLSGLPEYPNKDRLNWPKEWKDLPKPKKGYYTESYQIAFDEYCLVASTLQFDRELIGFSAEQIKGKEKAVRDYVDELQDSGFQIISEEISKRYGVFFSSGKTCLMSDKIIVVVMDTWDCSYNSHFRFDAWKIK